MNKKTIFLGSILVGLALAAIGFYQLTNSLETMVLEVQPGTLANILEEEGKIVPAVEHAIHSIYGGEVTGLQVEEGQNVQAGELLAIFDTTELKFQLQQINAQLKTLKSEEAQAHQEPSEAIIKSQALLVEQAELKLKNIETDLARTEQLYQDGVVTAKELEEGINQVQIATIALKQQQEALIGLKEANLPTNQSRQFYEGRAEALNAQGNLIRYQIEKSKIISPTTGIVANLTIKKGELINPGTPLMKIFQDSAFLVETYIAAEDSQDLFKDMPVKLTQTKQSEEVSFEGQVQTIAPTAVEKISPLGLEEQRVKITIKPKPPENYHLLAGTILDVEFITALQEEVLSVPKTAVFSYDKKDALWIVDQGKAKLQFVETGFENDNHVVITNGLANDTMVILNPQLKGLKEGRKIIPTQNQKSD